MTPAPTALTISPTAPAAFGVSVPFTATLTSSVGFTPIAPGGVVDFTANGTAIAGCTGLTLSSTIHAATCNTSSLVVTSDSIGASYSSDSNFQSSPALPVTQLITKNTPTVAVSSSLPTTAVVNQAVTFTATITPSGAFSSSVLPTQTVIFTKGSAGGPTVCGPAAVIPNAANGTSTASCSVPFGSAFSATGIFATYSGDTNFSAGNQPSVSQTVGAASTTTTITSPSSNISVGVNQSVTLAAIVAPANPGTTLPQSGTISFSDSLAPGTTLCSLTLTAGVLSPTTCTSAFTALGSHTVIATYTPSATDTNFLGSSVNSIYTVTVGTSSTTLTVSGLSTNLTAPTVDQVGDAFQSTFTNFPSNTPGTLHLL